MSSGGRQAREAARSRKAKVLEAVITARARKEASWLLTGDAAPKGAHGQLVALRRAFAQEAKTDAEAAEMTGIVLDLVDSWNAAHPGEEVAPPGPISLLDVSIPAWHAGTIADMQAARKLRTAFEAACAALDGENAPGAARKVAGLALLSALFDSACLSRRDLEVFALWLADPRAPVFDTPDLPPWIDLLRRAPEPRRPLRVVSGTDSSGDYALRRLFLAPRTIELVSRLDRCGGAEQLLKAAGQKRKGKKGQKREEMLIGVMEDACGESGMPELPRLMKGAALLLEARSGGPDHTMSLLAARRMESFAATPESFAALVSVGAGAVPAAATWTPPESLLAIGMPEASLLQRPMPEHPAFSQLHTALNPPRERRSDLSTPDRKTTGPELARRLKALRWGAEIPSCLALLRDWYLHLLETEGLAAGSVQRYHSTLGPAFCDMAGTAPLEDLDGDALEELYGLVLDGDQRSLSERAHLRNRLGMLHAFAMEAEAWDFPEIDPAILAGKGGFTRIDALLLGRRDIDRARNILRAEMDLPPDVARAADAAMLLMSRAGMRVGEAAKALWEHFEQVSESGLAPDEAVLFIRPSIFGNNKTPGAYRQIRPLMLMTAEEAREFEEYLSWRRLMPSKGPLFGVLQADGSIAPFDSKALGEIIGQCLRLASGQEDARSHSLRRAAATSLFLVLHEARVPGSGLSSFIGLFTGWTAEERARIAGTVAPATQARDCWHALARYLGHGGVGTSFSTYVMAADLAVFECCAAPRDRQREAVALGAIPKRHVVLLPSPEESSVRSEIRGEVASPALALQQVLERTDQGASAELAARLAYLPAEFVADRLLVAKAWSGLTTERGQLRLQSPERAGKLCPEPLKSAPQQDEAVDIANRLIELAGECPDEIRAWISGTLHEATQTNAGRRLKTPAEFRDWCAVAVRLREAGRWRADREAPPKPSKEDRKQWSESEEDRKQWSGIRPPEMQFRKTTKNTARRVVVRCRLMAPGVSGAGSGHPSDSWAGCIRFAAHLAAIYLGYHPEKKKTRSVDIRRGAAEQA